VIRRSCAKEPVSVIQPCNEAQCGGQLAGLSSASKLLQPEINKGPCETEQTGGGANRISTLQRSTKTAGAASHVSQKSANHNPQSSSLDE